MTTYGDVLCGGFPQLLTFVAILSVVAVLSIVPNDIAEAQAEGDWAGIFYPNTNFSDPLWLVTYPTGALTVNWGENPPIDPLLNIPLAEMPADNFSVRFSSSQLFNTGTYQFTVIADGGVKLTINDNVIIDNLDNVGLRTFTGTAFIGSGLNIIILDYIEYSGNALVEISWVDTLDLEATEEADIQSDIATAVVNGVDGLALRTGPYLGASLVAVLRPGNTYTVIGQNNSEGAHTWYHLMTNPAGQTGWASGRFLEVNLQTETTYSCNVTPELALAVAGTIPDPSLQISCTSAAVNAVNSRQEDGSIPPNNISEVTNNCATLFPVGTPISSVLTFIDNTEAIIAANPSCTANTTPGIFLPEEGSVFDNLTLLPDTGVTIAPRSVMNIRVRPSTRTAIVGQLPWGQEAQLLARTIEVDSDHWYMIRYSGIIGWIDASYVNVRGNINDVPTY